ncbi:MAG: Uma2 family endonuclease [Gemmatimonas sp.]
MATLEKRWTLEELQRLPDDGNRYEVVRGELFVTPAPRRNHEIILARLHDMLTSFVRANNLGLVFHRAIIRFDGSQVEPDLVVQQAHFIGEANWDTAPTPILVVEVLSDVTRRRDLGAKRVLYLDAGVAEYWVIDEEAKRVRVIRKGLADVVVTGEMRWRPVTAAETLEFDVASLFA